MRPVLLLLTATSLVAQVQTGASGDFSIQLSLPDSRPYQQTEIIPVNIRATGRPATQRNAPPPLPQELPAVRWQFGGFLVSPPLSNGTGQCGTASEPCILRGNGSGGWASEGWDVDFDKISDASATLLNDYVPVSIPPGRYQVSALARKLVLTAKGPMSATYGYGNPPETVVSNTVELQIVPATPQWISQTILSDTSLIPDEKNPKQARDAAKQLAILDTPAAWTAILSLLPDQENTMLREFSSTTQPGPLCDLLQARIASPAQAVSSLYLSTMTGICSRANGPPPPPAAPVRAGISPAPNATPGVAPPDPAPPDKTMQAYLQKLRDYADGLMLRSTNTLAASLAQKQTGAPMFEASKALLEYLRQLQYNRPRGATPNWAPQLAVTLVNGMPSLPPEDRRRLLPLFASTFPTASAASAFESVLDDWKPGHYLEEPSEALKALYKVDPDRARRRIVAELAKPETWLPPSLLDLLPPGDAPPMDDALVEALAGSRKYGALAPPMLLGSAIARYATPQALPRIRAIYESLPASCQPELVAYFLRVDAAYAGRILVSTSTQSCLAQYFERTAVLIMNPTLESFIVSYLMGSDLMKDTVYLKTAAAKALGKYGSEAARKPLTDTLHYFHDYWNGKNAELAKNGEGILQEEQLAVALAHARGWVATEADLQTIHGLCIAERCLSRIQQDLQDWRSPLRIEVYDEGAGIRGSVGPYSELKTLAELEAKLSQFPSGTSFLVNVSGPSYDAIEKSLRVVADRNGLLLKSR